ncbi:hypothetical protein [Mycolicibacterium fluoranthenivorans]|uniref:hypothetical protein n=1 Tax=Mycolicibacterium fluoranthenivorans TaxID=258505 RepID=UPI0014239F51|nr:hypothetical protein [Mycolicibacterium fluoranthenivorans]MCV7358520.1 hypothetical protein [Mycolicibacterium fluoranthenivorans]
MAPDLEVVLWVVWPDFPSRATPVRDPAGAGSSAECQPGAEAQRGGDSEGQQ